MSDDLSEVEKMWNEAHIQVRGEKLDTATLIFYAGKRMQDRERIDKHPVTFELLDGE